MNMKALLPILFLAVLFASVHDAMAQRMQKLRVAYIPIADSVGFYAAIEKGFFTDEGIKLDRTPMMGGAKNIEALLAGAVDLGHSAIMAGLVAVDKGFDIILIWGGMYAVSSKPTNAVIVRKDSGINNARDLEGKAVAIGGLNSIDHIHAQVWLERRGVDPKKITFLEIPYPKMVHALISKSVAAINAVEPFMTIALRGPNKAIGYIHADTVSQMVVAGFWAKREWVTSNADLVERFSNALRKGIRYINANPRYGKEVVTRFTRLKPELARVITYSELREKMEPESINYWVNMALQRGLIKKKMDVDRLIYKTAR